jgi:hypothetical protein
MFYKSILNAVAVVVAVMAVMFVGCGSDDEGGGGGGGDLVGDWSVLSVDDETIPDDAKMFLSFKSSNVVEISQFQKLSNFWIGSTTQEDGYRFKSGDSVCIAYTNDEGQNEDCMKYSISGDNLTLSSYTYYEYPCDGGTDEMCSESWTTTIKAKRYDIAQFKRDNNLKSQDPKLNETAWVKLSEDGENEWERARIGFNMYGGLSYGDSRGVYISISYGAIWYTESSHLILVGVDCDRYETIVEDGEYEWERCVSYSAGDPVTLEYQLVNETLRLRAPGGDWDVWIPSDGYYYFSQSKAKAKNGNGAIIPFWAFRR